jgi:hypothetical protein
LRSWRLPLAILAFVGVAGPGCQHSTPQQASMPPAYVSNQITDPALQEAADDIKSWASRRVGPDKKPLYSRVEVLPPVPIVQPYGVGVFQQEMRLSVILTTGPGWTGTKDGPKNASIAFKEAAVVEAFRYITKRLESLEQKPTLKATLTIQTPEGMELTWINHLETNGKYVHGDE